MALVFNGTSHSASESKGALNLQTGLWAIGVWHKRSGFSTNAHIAGVARTTGFPRRIGMELRDSGGVVASTTHYGGSSDEYTGTFSFPNDTWVFCLFVKKHVSDNTWNVYIGENSGSPTHGYMDDPTHFVLGCSYSSGSPDRLAPGKFAHYCRWEGTLPDATTIAQLRAGMVPSATDFPPDFYDPLISSNTLLTLVGSPGFDDDDPLASGPAVNPTGTDLVLVEGGSYEIAMSNMTGIAATGLVIRYTAGELIVNSTQAEFVYTPTDDTGVIAFDATRNNLPFGATGFEYVITLDEGDPIVYAMTSFSEAAGRDYIVVVDHVTGNTGLIYQVVSGTPSDGDQYSWTLSQSGLTLAIRANGTFYAASETFPETATIAFDYWSLAEGVVYELTADVRFSPDGEGTVVGMTAVGFSASGFTARGYTVRGF